MSSPGTILEIAAEFRPQWLAVWRRVLSDWLGWSQFRVDSWIRCWEDELTGRDERGAVWLYHDPVMRQIAPLLIPDVVANRLRGQRSDISCVDDLQSLQAAIEHAAALAPDGSYYYIESYDWEAAKDRVRNVLRHHAVSIPDAGCVTDYECRIRNAHAPKN